MEEPSSLEGGWERIYSPLALFEPQLSLKPSFNQKRNGRGSFVAARDLLAWNYPDLDQLSAKHIGNGKIHVGSYFHTVI